MCVKKSRCNPFVIFNIFISNCNLITHFFLVTVTDYNYFYFVIKLKLVTPQHWLYTMHLAKLAYLIDRLIDCLDRIYYSNSKHTKMLFQIYPWKLNVCVCVGGFAREKKQSMSENSNRWIP